MKKLSMVAGLLIAGYAANGFASGGTASTTFNVTATINAVCLVSASDLAFGVYDPLAPSDVDQSTTIDTTCSDGATYTVNLDGGSSVNNPSGSANSRAMAGSAGGLLSYNLYSDTYGGTVWGNDANGGSSVPGSGTGTQISYTVYGVVPQAQTFAPDGTYSDVITVDVSYF